MWASDFRNVKYARDENIRTCYECVTPQAKQWDVNEMWFPKLQNGLYHDL